MIEHTENRIEPLSETYPRAPLMATITNVIKWVSNTNAFVSEIDRGTGEIVRSAERAGRAVDDVEKRSKDFGSAMSGAVKIASVALAGLAIADKAREFISFAGTISDLGTKTGIGVESLQRLKYASDLAGVSLETSAGAVLKMSKALVEGDVGAIAATKRLGLNLYELRQMQPDKAFGAIAAEIAKIPNPMETATLALTLFGKSGAEVLPMIKAGLTDTMDAADRLGIVLDAETIAAGDRFGDTLTTLDAVGRGVIGRVLAPMVPAFQLVADAMTGAGNLVTWLQGAFTKLLEWGVRAIKFFLDAGIRVTEFASKIPILGSNMRDVDRAALESAKNWSVWFGDMANGMTVTVPAAVTQTTSLKSAVGLLDGPIAIRPNDGVALQQLLDAGFDLESTEGKEGIVPSDLLQGDDLREVAEALRDIAGLAVWTATAKPAGLLAGLPEVSRAQRALVQGMASPTGFEPVFWP